MFRIATLGFSHESNTFSKVPATLEKWRSSGLLTGKALLDKYESAQSTQAGFIAWGKKSNRVLVEPLMFSHLVPMGPTQADDYEELVQGYLDALAAGAPWDAVLLAQHGAAVSENFPDADGEFIRRVRELVGADTPIGVSVDLHANISEQMVRESNVLTVYQTNPHVDAFERAILCAELIEKTLCQEVSPTSSYRRVPIAINILRQGTSDEPMKTIMAKAREFEKTPGVLAINVVEGFPYADVPEMGMSVIVITDNDQELADTISEQLEDLLWESKQDFLADSLTIEQALSYAAQKSDKPVILLDTGDNVGGGSPGDTTGILQMARSMKLSNLAQEVLDPVTVEILAKKGVGASVGAEDNITVGGRIDPESGLPFAVTGTIKAVTDGKIEDNGPTHGGYRFYNLGKTVYLYTDDGFHLVITSRANGTTSQQIFRGVGIELENVDIIVANGVHSPRAGFGSLNAEFVQVGTPGCTSADLSQFHYELAVGPIFPFDEI